MRLDKYLKVSRLIKRRTVAKEVADHEKIMVNNKLSKPSTDVKINDIISIRFGMKIVTIKVLSINEYTKKEDSSLMYEIIKEESAEASTSTEEKVEAVEESSEDKTIEVKEETTEETSNSEEPKDKE